MAEQLEPNFTGSYVIDRITKANTIYLARMDGTLLKKTVSSARLKLFLENSSGNVTVSKDGCSKNDKGNLHESSLSEIHQSDSSTDYKSDDSNIFVSENSDSFSSFKPPEVAWKTTKCEMLQIYSITRPRFGTPRLFDRKQPPLQKNIKTMVSDGNCLFRAFSYCLTGSEKNHVAVRRAICNHTESNPATWAPIAGVDNITEYLDRDMRIPGTEEKKATRALIKKPLGH
ncbi:hypothetical protein Y032_0159g3290 [Ancylostoma ceylanicum]|uniref:OTU domain-containing protein n=1 Tax=Ancylostoma ceylanicum TaxID=53326 RepID=A0A016SYT8_9BILA|nr:hypothetical protein Y032_0159g3290 [Ancylostoma ceylanicum]